MEELVNISVDGNRLSVPKGTAVAAAIAMAGKSLLRRSVSGTPRGPLCGMGICGECRVTIDDEPHQRSCVKVCEEGMEVRTDG